MYMIAQGTNICLTLTQATDGTIDGGFLSKLILVPIEMNHELLVARPCCYCSEWVLVYII